MELTARQLEIRKLRQDVKEINWQVGNLNLIAGIKLAKIRKLEA